MKTDELINRSIFIITEYYKNNTKPFFESICDDVLWIGPARQQLIRGKENIIKTWANEKHNLTFTIGNIKVMSISPSVHVREIILHYDIYTHYPSGHTDLHDQRIHYTWQEKRVKSKKGSEYRSEIAMLHISNAFKYDERDTIYPVHYEQILKPMRILKDPERYVTVKSIDMIMHRIAASNILYVETIKRSAKLLIHTTDGTITANGTLLSFEKQNPDIFLRIHMSYIINPDHVRKLHRFCVTLSDGTELSIPEKKYTQIKKLLLQEDTAGHCLR